MFSTTARLSIVQCNWPSASTSQHYRAPARFCQVVRVLQPSADFPVCVSAVLGAGRGAPGIRGYHGISSPSLPWAPVRHCHWFLQTISAAQGFTSASGMVSPGHQVLTACRLGVVARQHGLSWSASTVFSGHQPSFDRGCFPDCWALVSSAIRYSRLSVGLTSRPGCAQDFQFFT